MKIIKLCFLVIFLFIISFSISCQKSERQIESEFLKNAFINANLDDNVHWIVILPGLGCHGCIQVAEAFMRDHIEYRDILFIITKVSSLKILQQKTGVKINEHPNVIVDREDLFIVPTKNGIYPCIIHVKDGKIKSYEFQSPQNGEAFKKLKSILTPS